MNKALGLALLVSINGAIGAEYLVKIKENQSQSFLNQKSNFTVAETFKVSHGSFAVVQASELIAGEISKNDSVEYIEPNHTYHTFNNDEDFGKQWGLKNTGWNSRVIIFPGKKGMDINAEEAWKITKGSKNVKIAVIDTGVDYNHPDLKENIMINMAEKNGAPGVDDDGNGYVDDIYGYDFASNDNDPMDGHGHGTHCAGVIGASHNSIGVAGVMAHVQILPIQFLGATGSGTLAGAVKAIDYAVSRGVDIMSNSWGGGGRSKALEEAVQKAEDKGILFVAAAGNESNDNDVNDTMPANIEFNNVVSVGAMDGKGKKASFSNFGKNKVHVFAPGTDIYSTVKNGGYKKMSGTSMACPHIAGVAGLLLANEPNLSISELKAKLMGNLREGADELEGYSQSGLVDAFKALK